MSRRPVQRFSLRSYAKLNLYLRVLGKRPDGYHRIETLFERIDLADTIFFSHSTDGMLHFSCSDPSLPQDDGNLCVRAARLLARHFGINRGCRIRLVKRIPHGSGLGGGSSNAACVLTGLSRLWNVKAGLEELCALGAAIGSDVPFFLHDCPFAFGRGRGELITPVPSGTRFIHCVAVPPVRASTREIYGAWDRRNRRRRSGLTKEEPDATMIFSAVKDRDFRSLRNSVFNSLEAVTRDVYPEVGTLKALLSRRTGVQATLMSGSGSAVFGVFDSPRNALAARQSLEKGINRVFLARTI